MKDVPPELAPSLVIGCVPGREDPRDVVVTRAGCRLEELSLGSSVGTSSLRRQAQLQAWRADLKVVPLRGNVDTRLRKCKEGQVDAIVLARAGLKRLGLLDSVTETLDIDRSLPAVGQGALAVEQRSGDSRVSALLAPLNHEPTARAVAAERGVMQAVGGDCKTPVAALAVRENGNLWLRGMLAEPDCSRVRRRDLFVSWPATDAEAHAHGVELGKLLLTSR
jgi:hydroxymethylbilane synthase